MRRNHRSRIVHGFISHAGGHGAVADHRDDIVGFAGEVSRHCRERRRDRRGGVRSAEGVVLLSARLVDRKPPPWRMFGCGHPPVKILCG